MSESFESQPPSEDGPGGSLPGPVELFKRRDGLFKVGEDLCIVRDGKAGIDGLTFRVLSNLVQPVSIETATPDESNLILDESCTRTGDIDCSGKLIVLGQLEAGEIVSADEALFYKILRARALASLSRGVKGFSSMIAERIVAEDHIEVMSGLLQASVINSEHGSVINRGGGIRGNRIYAGGSTLSGYVTAPGLVTAGVAAVTGGIKPLEGADPSDCILHAPKGAIYSTQGIVTGEAAAGEITSSQGGLELHGNGYCSVLGVKGPIKIYDGTLYYVHTTQPINMVDTGSGTIQQVDHDWMEKQLEQVALSHMHTGHPRKSRTI